MSAPVMTAPGLGWIVAKIRGEREGEKEGSR